MEERENSMDLNVTSQGEQPTSVRQNRVTKLSAIVFTDIKGFSRSMGESETLTLRLLRDHNRIIRFLTRKHGGRIVKAIGDGFLLDFNSAVEAVSFAIEAQERFARYNASRSDGDHIVIRVGISTGEVRVINRDLYGNDVNIASRLQTLADAGGICITRDVYDCVKSKLSVAMQNLGPQALKNIPDRVEVFKVLLSEQEKNNSKLDAGDSNSAVATVVSSVSPFKRAARLIANHARPQRAWSWAFAMLLPAIMLMPHALEKLGVAADRQFAITRPLSAGLATPSYDAVPCSDKVLAVAQFENRTGMEADEWLRTGMMEMLITDLESRQQFRVIGRPSFEAAIKAVARAGQRSAAFEKSRHVAERLNADILVCGSITRIGSHLRFDVQVYDVRNATLLLAEKVSGSNVIVLVDELTERLAVRLAELTI